MTLSQNSRAVQCLWAFSIDQKIPENSGNFGEKCLSVDVFHLTHSFHSIPGSLHLPLYFPLKYKMAAQLLLLNEMLDFSLEKESLVNSEGDFIPILAAVAIYMRRDLHRSKGLYKNILPACTIDEFKSHRRTRETSAEKYKLKEEFLNDTRLERLQFPLIGKF